jgi:hypothetical protein
MEEDKQEVKNVDINKQPLTPQDKMLILTEKNPNLVTLIKEFNLQFT